MTVSLLRASIYLYKEMQTHSETSWRLYAFILGLNFSKQK